MITLAIKCKNTKCNEVFHRNEIIFPVCNDVGYIDFKCKTCGETTRVPIYNPIGYGFGDNYEIVGCGEIEEKEEWSELIDSSRERVRLIEGYESRNTPIHKWETNNEKYLWTDGTNNFEVLAETQLSLISKELDDWIKSYKNAYLAGQRHAPEIKKIFVFQDYKFLGKAYNCIWAKECHFEKDYNPDNLYLIHHSGCNNLIDGVYTRDLLQLYLERLLVRWKMISNHVIIASPFIGFDFKFSKPENYEEISFLWNWLNGLQDIKKTTFLTRTTTYSSLKKTQESTEELKKWDLMSDLQNKFHDKKTRDAAINQFHFKIYAGIRADQVELFSGSYNIQTGSILENMSLRTLPLTVFYNNYVKQMVPDLNFVNPEPENVLCLYIDKEYNISYKIKKSDEIATDIPYL